MNSNNPNRMKLGIVESETQGNIIVKLEGLNIPKMGSIAQVKINGNFESFGRIVEAIGSTREPWIVIKRKKGNRTKINKDSIIYSYSKLMKSRMRRRKRKKPR